MSRPLVGVYSGANGRSVAQVRFAGVFESPIRLDVVHHVHRDIAKNHRQPYAVSTKAGHQTSAESWGTGRAVARIPRVSGGGTHRAGQGAFGNMCRGGRMFAPTKIYRRWHRKVNKNQRRFAIVSALAASASTALVLARGHRIERIPEVPLVVTNESIVEVNKTKNAVKVLTTLNAYKDVQKVKESKKLRAGKGKMRNRRYVQRRGPLIVYDKASPIIRAVRNLPGVEVCSVNHLNLLLLAPGGHLGRFVIWTRAAYERLDKLYGTYKTPSTIKHGYRLPQPVITNSDLGRLINSQEIRSHLKPKRRQIKYHPHKKNPLRNLGVMLKLNPYAKTIRRKETVRRELARNKLKKIMKDRKKKVKPVKTEKKARVPFKAGQKNYRKGTAKRNVHKKAFLKLIHTNL